MNIHVAARDLGRQGSGDPRMAALVGSHGTTV